MIDIHSHILPMVDDGASSVDMAIALLDSAYRDGSDAIVLTPHFAREYNFINPRYKITELFYDLKRIVDDIGIPIDLYLGCEYLYTDRDSFKKDLNDITTLNDTKYILVEFFFDVDEDLVLDAIMCIKECGFIPVIAHPERFECVQDNYDLVLRMCESGALLQMNKGSVLARYGNRVKDVCDYILSKHLYSFVGSDAHHIRKRSSLMYDAYSYVKEYYGKSYASLIFRDNAKVLLNIK